MKKSLFLLLFSLATALSAKSQGFVIGLSFYDSIQPTSYDLHMTGTASFTDSMHVFYSVSTNDSIPQVLFSDSVDFTATPVVFPAGFSYDSQQSSLAIALGNYPTKDLVLELISRVGGTTREHIYINIHNFETYLEDEE